MGETIVDQFYLMIGKVRVQVLRPPSAEALGLSPRELETMLHLAAGLSGKEAAQKMKVSFNTVQTYRLRIGVKLGATSKPDFIGHLIAYCLKQETGLVAQPGRG